ncbi:MAG: DUF5011 domain-containing protein, partial [Epsilonproteobacteria bacterium]|nr:DUF5011 domain-containing protein [Campylobacterota bacterium]
YGDSEGTIHKVYDKELKREVTQFKSQSSRDTYINGAKKGKKAWSNKSEKTIEWTLKYTESFVVMVSVKTLDGYRNLIYTSGNENGNLYFGLGEDMVDGEWNTITRDLERDLRRYEPTNSILSVNAFIIRGSGKIGKVELLKSKVQEPKKIKTQPTVSPSLSVKKSEKELLKEPQTVVKKENTPQIKLNRGELLYHKLGEPFFDPGMVAKDSSGEPLSVEKLGEVNINKVGRYVLTYMATDEKGNTTIKTRVVMVYKSGIAEQKKKSTPTPQDIEEEEDEFLSLPPLTEHEKVKQVESLEKINQEQEEMLDFFD